MNFSQFLTVQSWWEVPSIAYFCSLFRTAFKLLDFDIEELEEALLSDGLEESASSLLTELIVRLLNGCLGNNDISAFNYQMYLRRIFRQKCQETGRYNPFNTDIDFQFLPLRTKVEILYALCDFRLDADDVLDLFKNLEAESLRVEPLGFDDDCSAYWYFYGTRLYREDLKKKKGKHKHKKKGSRKLWFYGDDYLDEEHAERVWQVVCFTEEDWLHLTERFSKATSKVEKELYHSLSQNFLPEIPRLFQEKERLQRKRLLETAPRRTSNRVLQKIKQKKESKQSTDDNREAEDEPQPTTSSGARANRAKRRNLIRSKSESSSSSESSREMPQKVPKKRTKSQDKRSKNSSGTHKGEPPPGPPVKTGRKTNNSLASATGQILIPDNDEPASSTRKKLKTSQIFSQSEEDIKTDMYKVLEQITAHDDAWPFVDAVEEEYAPNYYAVIRRPMDLKKMEDRLDNGEYRDFTDFIGDFKLIVNNCRLYNGQDNEYTVMVDSLAAAFDRLTDKYMHRISSSDEEIAVEFPVPTPSRKHKLKRSDSPSAPLKKKKRKSHSESEPKSSSSDLVPERAETSDAELEPKSHSKKSKDSHRSKDKDGKSKKKHKGHHRRSKHSKKRRESKSGEREDLEREDRKRKKQKSKNKEKKAKLKKKKSRNPPAEEVVEGVRSRASSPASPESSHRSRSASPLPSIHSHSPSPLLSPASASGSHPLDPDPELDTSDQLSDPHFFKDKYDKIKERRRGAAKDVWESLFDYKQRCALEKLKNLSTTDKNKHSKLRETIKKLKAKHSEKYKDKIKMKQSQKYKDKIKVKHSEKHRGKDKSSKEVVAHGKIKKKDKDSKCKVKLPELKKSKEEKSKKVKPKEPKETKSKHKDVAETEDNVDDSSEDDEPIKKPAKAKSTGKRGPKKCTAKNESATEALEEAVKDMTKWFEDGPKGSTVSSPADSPAPTVSTEEQDSRQGDDLSQSEKSSSSYGKKEISTNRKRHASRDNKVVKRREIQRTIDRLQPGKSKGNLLTNVMKKEVEKERDESASPGAITKVRENINPGESSPKLSLGSVLPAVNFTLGKEHKFDKKQAEKVKEVEEEVHPPANEINPEEEVKPPEPVEMKEEAVEQVDKKEKEIPVPVTKKDAEVETEPLAPPIKPNQATPNLSAWFKAFGAPKSTPPGAKKKTDEAEEERSTTEPGPPEVRTSPNNPDTPNPEGGESPLPNPTATPRQRRTSTGSSVSERSSFSQDLDSPRHQMSLTSPLLRSPASPRDDFQKITYPIINGGSVRAGFYQDTTSIRSSPEKSCSPREGPTSPFSPYHQHVYAGNNIAGSATPQYFADHNKSPLPTYSQNPPPYYDSTKASVANKPRAHEDYTSLGPDTFQQPQLASSYSPVYSPYTQTSSNYSPVPSTLQPNSSNAIPQHVETKSSSFPMKKRMYNEPEAVILPTKSTDNKEPIQIQNKIEYTKPAHSLPTAPTSVDDIALALSEKSELAKLRENNAVVNVVNNDKLVEGLDTASTKRIDTENKKDTNTNGTKPTTNDSIDMVNMGYMNPDYDRRIGGESHENDLVAVREKSKSNATQQKVYNIDTIALNLGINNQPLHRTLTKNAMGANAPPAHGVSQGVSQGQLSLPHPMESTALSPTQSQPTHSQTPNKSAGHSQLPAHSQASSQSQQMAHTQPAHTQPSAHSQQMAHSQMSAHSQHLTHSQHLGLSQHPAPAQPAHSQPAAHSQHPALSQPAHLQNLTHSHHPAHSQPAHSQNLSNSQMAAHSQPAHSQNLVHSQHPAHSQNMSHSQLPAHSQPAHSQNLGNLQHPAHSQHSSQNLGHPQPAAHARSQTPAHARLQTPAHMQPSLERAHADMNVNLHAAHSHHLSHYDHLSGGQTISNFSMSDIEMANKKLYSSNTTPSTAIDYGNWKLSQMRKQDILTPSDYSAAYQHSVNQSEKHKQDMLMSSNYNKNMQQQYNMYNVPRASSQRSQEMQQGLPSELRIPNPRGHTKNDHVTPTLNNPDQASKHIDSSKSHKLDKLVQNHPLVTSSSYKTPYSTSALQLDSLRNLQNIPQMLERYSSDERFLSSFASSSSALYDKQFQMAQMFNKSIASELPTSSTSTGIYSQPSMSQSKDGSIYKTSQTATPQTDQKQKQKRKKRTSESKPNTQNTTSQPHYHTSPTADMLSVKSGMMSTGSFNYGTSSNMALGSGIYGDNAGFAANQLMAANYMVAAVAHQQRNSAEASAAADKLAKPAHQASNHPAAPFPFLGHSQVRPGYGVVPGGVETGSPLYQHYLQRQEELLRQTGAQIMAIYPPPYPASLGVSQPYDTINRHSWL